MNSGATERRRLSAVVPRPRVLVIGFGNSLRGDDAVGPIVAEAVQAESWSAAQVEVLGCQCLTPDLVEPLRGADRAIFLDASVDGPAGEVVCRRLAPTAARPAQASHVTAVAGLLGLVQQLYGSTPEAFLISIRGECFDLADRALSPTVAAAIPRMVDKVRGLVRTACQTGRGTR
jgi:hydrogenase maturation protease